MKRNHLRYAHCMIAPTEAPAIVCLANIAERKEHHADGRDVDDLAAAHYHANIRRTFNPRQGRSAYAMNRSITLRAASLDDEPFLLQLRKLTMTEHLERVALPVDDETHYLRMRSNFEDTQIICEARRIIGMIKLSRMTDEWHVHQIQVTPSH